MSDKLQMYVADGRMLTYPEYKNADDVSGTDGFYLWSDVDERITTLERELAEAKERADICSKLANVFGDTLCTIAETTDRVRACATASDKFAEMKAQLTAANATIAACKEAGFIREDGTVRCHRTADGVSLKPGDCIYCDDGTGYIQEMSLHVEFYGRTTSSLPSNRYYLDDCYSTYEAAAAAKEAQ